MCVYQGKAYSQGQRWDDGCQFQCECIDQQAGRYKCTERYCNHFCKGYICQCYVTWPFNLKRFSQTFIVKYQDLAI